MCWSAMICHFDSDTIFQLMVGFTAVWWTVVLSMLYEWLGVPVLLFHSAEEQFVLPVA